MTWRQLFARLWHVLSVRFARQHMCAECGDAMFATEAHVTGWLWGKRRVRSWPCPACEEQRVARLDERQQAAEADVALGRVRKPMPVTSLYAAAMQSQQLGGTPTELLQAHARMGHDQRNAYALELTIGSSRSGELVDVIFGFKP